MTTNLILVSGIFSSLVIFLILYFLKKEKIAIKYSIVWLLLFTFLLITLLIPGFLNLITHALGFQMSSNMIFSLLIGVLVIITISLTAIVSSQDKKIRLLIQEISIIKESIGEKNE